MNHIYEEDKALYKYPHQLENMPKDHLISIARQRGCELEDEQSIKEYMTKFWLPLTVQYKVSFDLMVWVALSRYSFCNLLVE